MGLQTWQYLLGISDVNRSQENSIYSSDFQFNQSISETDTSQSMNGLNSQGTVSSLAEAQNEILATIEKHFKMLNEKLQAKEKMENYSGILIGFSSLTLSFILSMPCSVIRNRIRVLTPTNKDSLSRLKTFNEHYSKTEGLKIALDCCCASLVYQSSSTITELLVNSIGDSIENKKESKDANNKNIKGASKTTKKTDNKPSLVKTLTAKGLEFIINYPIYKTFVCHSLNYPKSIFQGYKDIFSSIQKTIHSSFIENNLRKRIEESPNSHKNVTLDNYLSSSSSSSISPSSLSLSSSSISPQSIPMNTKWYSKFLTTVVYWVSYDLIEVLIFKNISSYYYNPKKKIKEKSKYPSSYGNRSSGGGRRNSGSSRNDQNTESNSRDRSRRQSQTEEDQDRTATQLPSTNSQANPASSSSPSTTNNDEQATSSQEQQQSTSQSQSQSQQQQQQQSNNNNSRTPQHSKVMKTSPTTMLKRVYIDVFCRFASNVFTKILIYPLETVCIKLLANGYEVREGSRPFLTSMALASSSSSSPSSSSSLTLPTTSSSTSSAPTAPPYIHVIDKNIVGFWSCCKSIYQNKGIAGFFEGFLYGVIPEILINIAILEATYYITNYLLKYIESKYEIIPKVHKKKKKRN